MTTYRLFPTNPAIGTQSSAGTPFLAGIAFEARANATWFQGYWWYVPTGGATATQTFALWCMTGGPSAGTSVAGTLVSAATVTSAATPLVAGQWNFIPLPSPIPISPATPYIAQTGYVIGATAFANQHSYFSGGGTAPAGITIANGSSQTVLLAYGDSTNGGTNGNSWGLVQGVFATGVGTDPTAHMATAGSLSSNYGMDVQVSDTAPAGYTGPFSLYPNTAAASSAVAADASVNYHVCVEVDCTAACTISALRYFSPLTATQLATSMYVWDIQSQSMVASNTSPSWSGAAASGWVQASFASPVALIPGRQYRIGPHNGAASPGVCFAKDVSDPWGTGKLKDVGIVAGPLTAPPLANAQSGFNYNNNPAGSPPYSDGTVVSHAQSPFGQSATGNNSPAFPLLWANGGTGSGTQNYFIDFVATLTTQLQPVVVSQAVKRAAFY